MPAIAGSAESISIDGRPFAVTADADVARKLGGFENEIQPNGDGTVRTSQTRVAWSLTGATIEVDDTRDDQEFLTRIQSAGDGVPITITYVSGTTYQGTGQIVGEVAYSNQSATASIDMSGGGELTKQ